MLVSVIIPTYCAGEINEERLLLSLAGYVNQNMSVDQYEVIVVDDGSEYDIKNAMMSCFGYNKCIHFINKEHSGFCSTVNFGIKRALGKYVLIATDDNVPAPDAISQLVNKLELNKDEDCIGIMGQEKWLSGMSVIKNPFSGKTFCGSDSAKADEIRSVFPAITIKTIFEQFEKLSEIATIPSNYLEISQILSEENNRAKWLCIRPGTLLVKKEKYLEIGGFDESFDFSGWYSDIEWGYRISKSNYFIQNCDSSVFLHFPHKKFYDTNQESRCFEYLVSKHPDPIIALLPFLWGRKFSEFISLSEKVIKYLTGS